MNSLPSIIENTYEREVDSNGAQVTRMFALLYPDISDSLVYDIAKIASYLQETKVNPEILPRVIRGVHNILIGTGHGQVILHVQKKQTNISVRETDDEIKTTMI